MTSETKELVTENHNLIFHFLNKRNMSMEEWYDVLAIALCNAAETFDENKSKFATYALKCMSYAVCKELQLQEHLNRKINKTTYSYEEKIKGELFNRDDATVQSILPNTFNTEIEAITNVIFLDCYNQLCNRDREIISMLADGYNMKEIGRKFGITSEAVRLIKIKFRQMLKRRNI